LYVYTGDLGTAQELVQEAFCRAFTRWDKLSAYEDPVAWVRRVAFNLANNRWCRAKVALKHMAGHREQHTTEGPNPDRVAAVAALAQLPAVHRRALVLHYLICRFSTRWPLAGGWSRAHGGRCSCDLGHAVQPGRPLVSVPRRCTTDFGGIMNHLIRAAALIVAAAVAGAVAALAAPTAATAQGPAAHAPAADAPAAHAPAAHAPAAHAPAAQSVTATVPWSAHRPVASSAGVASEPVDQGGAGGGAGGGAPVGNGGEPVVPGVAEVLGLPENAAEISFLVSGGSAVLGLGTLLLMLWRQGSVR
jgi:hypothetical protein